MCRYPGKSEERVGCLEPGVTGGHESPHVGAGKRTLVLWKRYEAVSYGTFFFVIYMLQLPQIPLSHSNHQNVTLSTPRIWGNSREAVAYSFLSIQKYGRKSGKQASCPVFIHTGVP